MKMFQLKPSQVRKAVIECMEANLVPMVTSSPGLGKSSIYSQIAKDFSLDLIDLRLSQCAPEDLMGLPMRKDNGKAAFVPFEMFPTASTPMPKGKNGWLLNLDEFNSAAKSVQAAAYKIVLDRMVGQEKLHENVFIVCAGNLATDRAIVNQMSTAMQSRLVHLEMIADHRDFVEYAIGAGIDHRILGFLEFQPSKLHSFKPDHDDKTFACPRTWEFASRLINGKSTKEINLPVLAGTISQGVAVEFNTFIQEYDKLPGYASIIADPNNTPIPNDPSTKYALVTMLLEKFDSEQLQDLDPVIKYVKKLPSEFQVIYFRQLAQRHPNIRREKVYAENILHLVKFLNDDSDAALAA